MEVGPSEAEPFWTEFLRSLTRRGLRGVKLVISDGHEGLKKAAAKVLSCRPGSAAACTSCAMPWPTSASKQRADGGGRHPHRLRAGDARKPHEPSGAPSPIACVSASRKLAELMDEAEDDVLAYMAFPKSTGARSHSTNPLERLNGEIKRRTDVVAIFPNEAAIVRLVGAILLEQNDEWAVSRAAT